MGVKQLDWCITEDVFTKKKKCLNVSKFLVLKTIILPSFGAQLIWLCLVSNVQYLSRDISMWFSIIVLVISFAKMDWDWKLIVLFLSECVDQISITVIDMFKTRTAQAIANMWLLWTLYYETSRTQFEQYGIVERNLQNSIRNLRQ